MPRRVCAAAGDGTVIPLLATLSAGVITRLVVVELTATRLVEVDAAS